MKFISYRQQKHKIYTNKMIVCKKGVWYNFTIVNKDK